MASPDRTVAAVRSGPASDGSPLPKLTLRRREALAGYVAILPWLVGFLLFTLGPIAFSFVLMFMKWELITPPEWAGLANFRRLMSDPLALKSLWNTLYYTVFAVPLNLVAALFAATMLNVGVRGTNVYRALIYLPSQMPAVAIAILWFFIFSPTYGLANGILGLFGMPPQKWLWDVDLVKPSLVLMAAWGLGNSMIIFLAGLQGIPETLYEAAMIDGAGAWRLFLHVTLPMLSPSIFFNLTMGVIGSFQVFTNVFMMTAGGPGNASLMLVLYVYRNAFANFKMGYASVLAWLLLVIVLTATLIQLRVSRMWVYYEGEVR